MTPTLADPDSQARAPAKAVLPVTIITGFLGSGKTTLLNRLVKQPGMQATAVVINEFGEVGIDHLLVETSTELMVELNNGCICCTIRGDLADKLGSLAMWIDAGRLPPVERVVVETTGLADPAPIMHTLMVEPDLLSRYTLGRIVTVVDAIAGAQSLDRFHEAARQIAVADLIVVAKTDLIASHSSREAYARLRERVRALNPRAPLIEAVQGALDPATLLGSRQSDDEAVLAGADAAVDCHDCATGDPCSVHGHAHGHTHEDTLREERIASFVIELHHPVEQERFSEFLQALVGEFGPKLLRMKGVFAVAGVERPAVVHGVQHVLFPVTWLPRWPTGTPSSRFVFITQDLPATAIRERFRGQFSAG